ncbi:MAG: RNA polymerase Rpb4 family protein [Methanophagales archaeon]|nr:RNA polymerase Rpb4 family protein [Methanophagales archaeon]MCW7073627.1 RNA polymerase Rpb4 family protein [Methanophagales archaeon]
MESKRREGRGKEKGEMIVKEIIKEEVLTLAEAKEILVTLTERMKEAEGREEEEEVRYEQRKALEHASKFAKLDVEDSKALISDLMKLKKMNNNIAVRIADLMPRSKNEVRAIYAKEQFTLSEEDIEEILDCIARYI